MYGTFLLFLRNELYNVLKINRNTLKFHYNSLVIRMTSGEVVVVVVVLHKSHLLSLWLNKLLSKDVCHLNFIATSTPCFRHIFSLHLKTVSILHPQTVSVLYDAELTVSHLEIVSGLQHALISLLHLENVFILYLETVSILYSVMFLSGRWQSGELDTQYRGGQTQERVSHQHIFLRLRG